MSPEAIGGICIVVLLVLLYLRMWIGLAMFFVGFWGLVVILGWDPSSLVVLATVPYRTIGDYTFAALPLFVMMGMLLYYTGIGTDLFNTAYKWMGQVRGGLSMAASVAAAIFGVITDSTVAVITLGRVAMPEMRKYKYDDSLSSAGLLAGASLATLVPPSIGFIIYALLTGQSVGKLFIGALLPALVLTGLIILITYLLVRKNPGLAPTGPKTSFKEKIGSLKYTWAAGALILLILGGIYGGIFTPTEAGAIGCFGAIIIGFIGRRLNGKGLRSAILETVQTTAMIVLMMAGAYVFMRLMAVSKLPLALSEFVVSLDMSPYLILTMIILLYIILGMFTDIMSSMLLTVPILYPVITALGFDPIWWGIVLVMLVELGLYTPPMGQNAFLLSQISGISIGTIFRGVWPFVLVQLIWVIILTIFPQIVLWLPSNM